MSFRSFWKFSLIYIFIFLCLHFILFRLLKNQQKQYSQSALNELIYTVSSRRPRITNPCQSSFSKDPYSPNYYKINLVCSLTSETTNTLDLDAVADKTVGGVITEFARIMNFDPKLIIGNEKSICFSTLTGNQVNFNIPIVKNDTLKCYLDSSLKPKK